MKHSITKTIVALALFGASSSTLMSHRSWLLPSATILSGEKSWVTIDAAVSNDLFYINHRAMSLENIEVTGPEGAKVEMKNKHEGQIRSSFDLEITKPGTYKVESLRDGFFARWTEGEERKRWRGTAEELKKLDLKGKEGISLTKSISRNVTYLTNGKPNTTALKPTGKGLEISFTDTHPNDLFEQEEGTFTLLNDGKPAKEVEVEIHAGNQRFRNAPLTIKVKTDANGKFSVTWPEPGRYWLDVSVSGEGSEMNGLKVRERASLSAVFEVLPE